MLRPSIPDYFSVFSIFVLFSCSNPAGMQEGEPAGSPETTSFRQASSFFPADRAKVLVVGTFHFDYPGLDVHQISDEDKVDVLSGSKQKEVMELAAYIKRFNPNKIAIEAFPEWNAAEKLEAYRHGKSELGRDERYQLGIRLAAELDLDTIYSIDAGTLADDLEKLNPEFTDALFQDFDFQSDDPMDSLIGNWMDDEDKLAKNSNLLDYFKHINSRESHQYGYGIYLTGDFKLDHMRGADIISIWWYNRNIRIFRKLQEITEGKEDRILVLFGNGHAAVLRQLLECAPDYEFVEFDSL